MHTAIDGNMEITRTSAKTVRIQWDITVAKTYRSLAWWKIKLTFFHVTMLTTFVLSKTWYFGKRIFVTVFFLVTYPAFLYCPTVIYWWAITFSTLGFLHVDLVRIILQALDTRARLKERDKYTVTISPAIHVKLLTWVMETYYYFSTY